MAYSRSNVGVGDCGKWGEGGGGDQVSGDIKCKFLVCTRLSTFVTLFDCIVVVAETQDRDKTTIFRFTTRVYKFYLNYKLEGVTLAGQTIGWRDQSDEMLIEKINTKHGERSE